MKALLLAAALVLRAAAQPPLPEFAVRTSDGRIHSYVASDRATASARFSDRLIEAEIRREADGLYVLELRAVSALAAVYFPWESQPEWLDDPGDDVVYLPRLQGVAIDAQRVDADDWESFLYPGELISPLVILGDARRARLLAAANWPPRTVRPRVGAGRFAIEYPEGVRVGASVRCAALVLRATGDATKGDDAWRLAADAYVKWLDERMTAAGVAEPDYPPALRDAHGWQQVLLHFLPAFDADDVRRAYERRRDVLPWVQFWGQMSNYQRDSAEGRDEHPSPPLGFGERTGCCVDEPELHSRYRPGLSRLAQQIVGDGGVVGYYQRPRSPYGRLAGGVGSPDVGFLLNWIEVNRRDGANAFYLDVVGAKHFGEALAVADLLRAQTPSLSVTERTVDVYPAAALVSGALWGGPRFRTRPQQKPADFNGNFTRCTFPRLGRTLLPERPMFLGGANGDFMYWGDFRGHECWTERQAFLLGAKFDAPTRFKGQPGWVDPVTRGVAAAIAARERVGWWQRGPRYRDHEGLSEVPDGVEVRRFVDGAGVTLLAVDNWSRRAGLTFRYRGRPIPIPDESLSVLELPRELEP